MRKILSVCSTLLLGVSAAPALASQLVSTFSVPGSQPDWYMQDYFTPIDSSLYVINSVDLQLSGNIYGNIQVQNLSQFDSGNISVSSNGSLGIYYPDLSAVTSVAVAAPVETQTLTPYVGADYFSDSSSYTNPNLQGSARLDTLLTAPAALNYFYTSGQGYLYLVGMDFSTVTTDLATQNQINTLIDGTLTITIDYSLIGSNAGNAGGTTTDVPEPYSAGLFGAGFLALMVVHKRRRLTQG